MLPVVPGIYGDVHYGFVTQGQAVNQQYYIDMLQCLQ